MNMVGCRRKRRIKNERDNVVMKGKYGRSVKPSNSETTNVCVHRLWCRRATTTRYNARRKDNNAVHAAL